MMRYGLTGLMLLLGTVAFAEVPPVKLVRQALEQGGFVVAQTVPGAQVTLNGKHVPVTPEGEFVVGLDRFQQPENQLKVCVGQACKVLPLKVKKRSYVVQKVMNVPQKTVEPSPQEVAQIDEDNKVTAEAREVAWKEAEQSAGFAEHFRLPLKGPTSGVFGSRRTYNGQERSWHRGHDLAASTGTPIYAPADGVVRMARLTFMSGNLVMLDHGGGLTTVYAHMSEMDVEKGQKVTAGDLIGRVGTTGRSSGPHLHWGMYWQNTPIDPILWVADKPETPQPRKAKR